VIIYNFPTTATKHRKQIVAKTKNKKQKTKNKKQKNEIRKLIDYFTKKEDVASGFKH